MKYILQPAFLSFIVILFFGCDSIEYASESGLTDVTFENIVIERESPPNVETGVVYSKVTLETMRAVGGPPALVDSINYHIAKKLVGYPSYETFIENYLPDENYIPRFIAPNFGGRVSLVRQGLNVVTFRLNTSDANLCGASCSGAIKVQYANIDDRGKLLTLSDVVTDKDEFFTRAKDYIVENISYWEVSHRTFFLPPDWYITNNGIESHITLQFQAYEVNVGAAGTVAVNIPMRVFEDLRVPRYWIVNYEGDLYSDL